MLNANLLKSSSLMSMSSLILDIYGKPSLFQDAAHEFLKEELNPFSSGEWLKLESAEEKLGPLEENKLSPSKEKITSGTGLDDDESKEEEEKESKFGLGETEENRRILKGPIWNYPLRKMSLDNEYYNYILFGVQRQFLKTPEERILKGEQWVAKKPITSSMAVFLLRHIKKINPMQTALVELETGRKLTYGEFAAKAESLACGLHWLGIQPKQVVSIVSFNSLEAHVMVLACLLVGAIVAFVDSSLNPVEMSIILRIVSSHFVFTEVGKTQYRVEIAIGYLSSSPLYQKPQLIINSTTLPESSNYFLFHQLLKEVNPKEKTPGPRRSDPLRPVIIIFTENQDTKGYLLSEQYFTNSKAFVDTVLPPCDDPNFTVMVTSPMYCNTAIKTIINNLIDGHRIIVCRGQIPVPCLITALRRFEVFAMLTLKTTLMNLLYWPAKPRCPNLKLIAVTGLPLRLKNLLKIHNDIFNKKVQIMQLYDLVETGPVAANTFLESRIGSVGKPFYNVEMKVLEEGTDVVLGPNQEGELCVKSPTMAIGYYNCKNDVVENLITDHEGFIHTGDLGYYDDEGFVYVIDKICDMIKWRTYMVSPSRVGAVLMEQPEVKEALVSGVFHEQDGELVTAAVIFEFGYEQTNVDDFEKKVNLLLPHHRKIRGGIYTFQQFPRSSTGKPLKVPILKEVLERKKERQNESCL